MTGKEGRAFRSETMSLPRLIELPHCRSNSEYFSLIKVKLLSRAIIDNHRILSSENIANLHFTE